MVMSHFTCMLNLLSLFPRPSPPPVFDPYCKGSKTGGREGLGMRIEFTYLFVQIQSIHGK